MQVVISAHGICDGAMEAPARDSHRSAGAPQRTGFVHEDAEG